MSGRTFVDTNVWVYTVDGADAAKRRQALAAVAPGSHTELIISSQVLTEFYTVITRKLAKPVTPDRAAALIDQLALLPVVAVDTTLVQSAILGSREWGISLWDALIISAAETAGCSTLLTEDLAAGQTYGSVRVENPFR